MTKPTTVATPAHVYKRGFSFFDAEPLPEALALDLLTSMGFADVVADYLAYKNFGWDLRGFLAYTLVLNLAPTASAEADAPPEF